MTHSTMVAVAVAMETPPTSCWLSATGKHVRGEVRHSMRCGSGTSPSHSNAGAGPSGRRARLVLGARPVSQTSSMTMPARRGSRRGRTPWAPPPWCGCAETVGSSRMFACAATTTACSRAWSPRVWVSRSCRRPRSTGVRLIRGGAAPCCLEVGLCLRQGERQLTARLSPRSHGPRVRRRGRRRGAGLAPAAARRRRGD